MEEAAEAQEKVCDIHYKQMEKPDRDPMQRPARRGGMPAAADAVPQSASSLREREQRLRNIQEVLAEARCVAAFLSSARAASRRRPTAWGVVDQYPLYSRADEALWLEGDSYGAWAPRFRQQAGDAYTRIVRIIR